MFEVGKQVVCIETVDWWDHRYIIGPGPVKGQVVTIRDIMSNTSTKALGLMFYELSAGLDDMGLEMLYDAKYFKPVKNTSIDQFTEILKTVDHDIKEDA